MTGGIEIGKMSWSSSDEDVPPAFLLKYIVILFI